MPSPQLCMHIWQAQPSPGTPCPALQLPADAVSHRQPLASKPCLCCSEGTGVREGFFSPYLLRAAPVPLAAAGLGYSSTACPLPPCQEQRCRARELAVTTAKPWPVPARQEPPAKEPPLKPWYQKQGSFARLEEGGRLLLPQNLPPAPQTPIDLPGAEPRAAHCPDSILGMGLCSQ